MIHYKAVRPDGGSFHDRSFRWLPDTTVSESRDHQDEPIVRTVGDLTARHIGQSVRVFEGPFFTLRHLSSFIRGESTDYIELGAEWDDDPDEWEYFETPLDTPCEVLP